MHCERPSAHFWTLVRQQGHIDYGQAKFGPQKLSALLQVLLGQPRCDGLGKRLDGAGQAVLVLPEAGRTVPGIGPDPVRFNVNQIAHGVHLGERVPVEEMRRFLVDGGRHLVEARELYDRIGGLIDAVAAQGVGV